MTNAGVAIAVVIERLVAAARVILINQQTTKQKKTSYWECLFLQNEFQGYYHYC